MQVKFKFNVEFKVEFGSRLNSRFSDLKLEILAQKFAPIRNQLKFKVEFNVVRLT